MESRREMKMINKSGRPPSNQDYRHLNMIEKIVQKSQCSSFNAPEKMYTLQKGCVQVSISKRMSFIDYGISCLQNEFNIQSVSNHTANSICS